MSVIKVAMIGVCGVLLAVFLKQQKNEYALYISMGAAVLILLLSVLHRQSISDRCHLSSIFFDFSNEIIDLC